MKKKHYPKKVTNCCLRKYGVKSSFINCANSEVFLVFLRIVYLAFLHTNTHTNRRDEGGLEIP
jgi:hypothetical protein